MKRGVVKVFLAVAALLVLLPAAASAQEGQIAGTVRDSMGAVMPGVTVDVTSPALIEKLRSTTTDTSGQYRITALPVGTYQVTFTLAGFSKQQQNAVSVTSGGTASVNATMGVGQVEETIVVSGAAPVVDVQNAREVVSFEGEQIRSLPTSRNVNSLLTLTPGINSMYKPSSTFGAPGVCVGGIGVFCNPGVNGFNVGDNDTTNLAQGRVLVDGAVVNQGGSLPLGGSTGGYTADIANSQEVNVQVAGALGESETGGAAINIVPRTGGNRFAGDFNWTYTHNDWFAENNGKYANINSTLQTVVSDHDVSMAFGGPIKRDKLWFYAVGRDQGIHKLPVGVDFWPNLNEGKAGYVYQPDKSKDRVEYRNIWRNANARVTWQASARNKFNFFWDEQDFCQDPCLGVVSVFTSPESWWSVSLRPDRLQQASWTNPLTSKILLEAGLSVTSQTYDTTKHREYDNPIDIPRVVELGDTSGAPHGCFTRADCIAQRVNQFAGGAFFQTTSGSLNKAGAETRLTDNYRMRGSASYVTGSHHAKLGYDGAYFGQDQTAKVNNSLLTYNYVWPAATCNPAIGGCGNTSLQFPEDPNNLGNRPIPNSVSYNTGSFTLKDHVWVTALYAQDQWTKKRFTLSGALRYDHATSGYGSSCIGPNKFVSVGYCTDEADGVTYKDLTPRYGATYDVFGNGKTAIRFSGGKYLNAAGITGVYSGANPARRTVNDLQRSWNDTNGNRIVDCDLMNPANNGECTGFVPPFNNFAQFGKDPASLDASGSPIGLTTTQCGRTEAAIPAAVKAYCNAYGESVVDGWGRRRSEWQWNYGIQHEILPRLSGEFNYNRRKYINLLVSDQLNIGCDRYNGKTDITACQEAMLRYSNPSYDFYKVVAPVDPRLPNGGGYTILGLFTDRTTQPAGQPTAQTYNDALQYTWQGFDTQLTWRGPGGLRVQGGGSTGRSQRNTCHAEPSGVGTLVADQPNVRGREGAEWQAGCDTRTPYQWSWRGTAAYNIPKIDVLVSTVFQSLPGVDINPTATYDKSALIWMPESANRATDPCSLAANGVGCLGATRNTTTANVNLALNNEMWGERTTFFDMKFAKNIRFSGKRASVGVDVYNIFNSDAIQSYNATYTLDNPATPTNESLPVAQGGLNNFLQPISLLSPRYVRLQLTFNF
jgi:Carboxypeptidase regulatory-like domain